MYSPKGVAVVIPAYNEAPHIAEVVTNVPAFVEHIIVVNDHSRDDTARLLAECPDPRLVVLTHERNQGVGRAIVSGYRRALALKAKYIAVMGGDGQMLPEELTRLLVPLTNGEADYTKGNRFLSGLAWQTMPFMRYVGNVALSWLSKPATGYFRIFDTQCGYTAATAEVLRRLPLNVLYPRYGYPNDMLARLHAVRARVVDVPVTPVYPDHHSHMQLRRVTFKLGWLLLRLYLRRLLPQRTPAPSLAEEPADG